MTHSRLELSVTNFQKSVELNPNNEPAFFSLIHLKGRICDWREYAQTFEKGMCVLVWLDTLQLRDLTKQLLWSTQKSPIYLHQSPVYLQKSPVCLPKSPTYLLHSLVSLHKSPVHLQKSEWLTHMCDMTHSNMCCELCLFVMCLHLCATWSIHLQRSYTTYAYVRHDSLQWVWWIISICNMPISMCDMFHSYVRCDWWGGFISDMFLIDVRVLTPPCLSLTPFLTYTHSLLRARTRTLSLSLSPVHLLSFSLAHALSFAHALSLSHTPHTHTHSLFSSSLSFSFFPSLSLSFSLSLSHTSPFSLTLSLSLSLPPRLPTSLPRVCQSAAVHRRRVIRGSGTYLRLSLSPQSPANVLCKCVELFFGCTGLGFIGLRMHRALLWMYRALLQMYRALLWMYRALLWMYRALNV